MCMVVSPNKGPILMKPHTHTHTHTHTHIYIYIYIFDPVSVPLYLCKMTRPHFGHMSIFHGICCGFSVMDPYCRIYTYHTIYLYDHLLPPSLFLLLRFLLPYNAIYVVFHNVPINVLNSFHNNFSISHSTHFSASSTPYLTHPQQLVVPHTMYP